jgi:pentatricopeptide repeat protein
MGNQKTVRLIAFTATIILCIPLLGTAQSISVDKPITESELAKKIQGSYGFLSNREPALNQGEYAIVEKFLPFLEEDPNFALEMIEGLTANNQDLSASFDFVLGNLYYQSQREPDALQSYKKALAKYPDYMRAWRSIGWISLYAEDYETALDAFGKAIKLGDTEPDTFGQIGYCYYLQGDHMAAQSAYSQALLYDPTNLDWMRGNLSCHIALGNNEAAIVILESLTRRQPEEGEFWRTLSNLYIQQEDFIEAAACMEFLRLTNEMNFEEYDMLARVYINTESFDLAAEVFIEMIAKGHVPDGDALLICVNGLYKNQWVDLADRLHDSLSADEDSLSDESRALLVLIGSKRAELAGDLPEAERVLTKGLEIGKRLGDIRLRLGIVQFQGGKSEASLETLALAESHASSRRNALIAQAQILMSMQSYYAAGEKLEVAIAEGAGDHASNLYQDCMHAARKQELDRISLTQGTLQ